MISSVTIWIGRGQRDLLGDRLHGNGNCDLSLAVTYRVPGTNYRGLTAVKLPKGALVFTVFSDP